MNVKDIIKNRRLQLNLTMKELSDKVGVSEGTISRWESGEIQNMRRDKVLKLSSALNLEPGDIMGWDKSKIKSEERGTASSHIDVFAACLCIKIVLCIHNNRIQFKRDFCKYVYHVFFYIMQFIRGIRHFIFVVKL